MGKTFRVLLFSAAMAANLFARGSDRIDFTVSGYSGTETLTNFPVLVRLSAAIENFSYSRCAPDGADLTFTMGNTVLPREIESWNVGGESLIWVRLPELKNGMVFHAYLNDPEIADQPPCQTDGSVWKPAGYIGVWHMAKEEAGDSSASGHDGTFVYENSSSGNELAAGRIGRGYQFNGHLLINCGTGVDSAIQQGFSVEGWVKSDAIKNERPLMEVSGCFVANFCDGTFRMTTPGIKDHRFNQGVIRQGVWSHAVYSFIPSETLNGAKAYQDGCRIGQSNASRMNPLTASSRVNLGANQGGRYFEGVLDEVRLSKVVPTDDWVRGTYETMADPSFLTSSEVFQEDMTLAVTCNPPVAIQGLVPALGVHGDFSAGKTFDCSAPAEEIALGDGAKAYCIGWRLYSYDPEQGTFVFDENRENATGDGTAFTYKHPVPARPSKLEWQFAVSNRVTAAVNDESYGSVDTPVAWLQAGDTITIMAVPREGRIFAGWTGDIQENDPSSSSITLKADGPLSVTAVFQPVYYVSKDGSDDDTGATLEKALATVSNALWRANLSGGQVIISRGTYELSDQLSLTNAVQVRGATDAPEDVILRRPSNAKKKFRIIEINHPEASVSYLTVEGGIVNENWKYGGGVMISPAGGSLTHCIIRNCRNTVRLSGGGGLSLDSPNAFVSHCIVTNNSSSRSSASEYHSGSALLLDNGHVENSLFAYNRVIDDNSRVGHTVAVLGGQLVNCTIVRNAATAVGGVYANKGMVQNCLIAENTTLAASPEYPCWGGKSSLFDHCATDMAPINDSCPSGPAVALADLWNGDFRPTAASFLVDAGARDAVVGPLDLDGKNRVSGEGIDIGCYELDQSDFSIGFIVSSAEVFAPTKVKLSARAKCVGEGDDIEYHWMVKSASDTILSEENGPVFEFLCTRPGSYDVTLCATNRTSGKSASAFSSLALVVGTKTSYVVPGNPGAAFPYGSWETASATIQPAIDSAYEGSEVVLTNGVYSLKGSIFLRKNITVRGVTGRPEDVVLRRNPKGSASRVLEVDAGTNALVHGLTLTDGCTGGGGNLYIHTRGGSVSNCIIRNGRCTGFSIGGGFLLDSPAGLITHCVISNNTSESGRNDGRGGTVHGTAGDILRGRLEHSLITGNNPDPYSGATFRQTLNIRGGAIRYCTVAGNVSTNCAGINCLGGTVEHCVIAGNRSARPEEDFSAWGTIDKDEGGHSNLALSNNFVCCIADVTPINGGCLQAMAEKLFVSCQTGDFHLRRGSPAVDVVFPGVAGEMPSVDLDGKPRLELRRYDLGCYEQTYVTPGTVLFLR